MTHVAGVTNPTTTVGTTVKTPVETLVPTTGKRQLVPADSTRLVAATRGECPHTLLLISPMGGFLSSPGSLSAAVGNTGFSWGVPTVQTPSVDATNSETNQGQVPDDTPDTEDDYRGPHLHF